MPLSLPKAIFAGSICALLFLTAVNVQSISRLKDVIPINRVGNKHSVSNTSQTDIIRDSISNDWKKLFPTNETRANGANFTRTLVVASTKDESTSWISDKLHDILAPNGPLNLAIYLADDVTVKLRPPLNKGREANIYLSYIIDFYDALPDFTIFMHSHRTAWHNNDLLDSDAALTVRNLSPARVISNGYANLRCHWNPGCPDWIHPGTTQENDQKYEEVVFASAWANLFPNVTVPQSLSQPCCAQFAVSRERIHSQSKDRYIELRHWLYNTELSDFLAGRIFEYIWHYIFTSETSHCPSPHSCYCELYGVCFESNDELDDLIALNGNILESQFKLMDQQVAESRCESCGPSEGKDYAEDILSKNHTTLYKNVQYMQLESTRRIRTAFDAGRRKRGL